MSAPQASPPATSAPTTAVATEVPSPTLESAKPLAPLDGMKVYVQDPDVEITLPEGWRYVSVDEMRTAVESQPASELSTPESRSNFEEKLASGRLRMGAEGLTPLGVQVGFRVTVEEIESISEATTALADEIELSSDVDTVQRGTIDSPLGDATWLRFAMQLPDEPGYAPSNVMAYLIPVDGGRMLIIDSVGRQDDSTHRNVMDQIVGTVRRPSVDPIPATPGPRLGMIPGSPTIEFEYPDPYLLWPIDSYRTALQGSLANLTGSAHDDTVRGIKEIDDGIVRLVLIQSRVVVEITGLIFVLVDDTFEEPEAAADRMFSRLDLVPGSETRTPMTLPIGEALRVEARDDSQRQSTMQHVVYIITLADGQTITVSGSAEDPESTFSDVMSRFADSLSVL
jgi:hypothetical protein